MAHKRPPLPKQPKSFAAAICKAAHDHLCEVSTALEKAKESGETHPAEIRRLEKKYAECKAHMKSMKCSVSEEKKEKDPEPEKAVKSYGE